MNLKHMCTIICTALLILIGLFLTCGLGPLGASSASFTRQDQSTCFDLDQPDTIHASANPTLPRTFDLPIPLFAPDSAWNQTATTAEVLPTSDQQILVTYRVLRGDTTDLYPPGPPTRHGRS